MSTAAVRGVVRHFAQDDPPSDAALLARYTRTRDSEAFAELIRRHGPIVFGVCRRLLVNSHDAEDAFQAVFLVLARKAETVRPAGLIGNWLHGVAVRTANKAKIAAARRWRREMASALASRDRSGPERSVGGDLDRAELRAVIDQELGRLPETLRAAVVLCDLGGKSRAEAARELGCPDGTIAARLHRARKLLAERLTHRGIALSAGGLAAVLTPEGVSAAVPADLARSALAAAEAFTGGASHALSPTVRALAEGVLRTMSTGKFKLILAAIAAAAITTGAGAIWGIAADAKPEVAEGAVTAPVPNAPPSTLVHGDRVHGVSYSPGGKQFLAVGGGRVNVWQSESRKKLFAFDADFAAFSGDGKSLFALVEDKMQTLDAATGKVVSERDRNEPRNADVGTAAAFAPDGKLWVEFDGIRHHLRPLPIGTGKDTGLAGQHEHNPLGSTLVPVHGRNVAFSPSGRQLAGIHAATTDFAETACLTIWQPQRGHAIGTIHRDNHAVQSFAWSPDGKQIAVGFGDGVRIYDPFNLEVLRILDKPGQWGDPLDTTALAWSADGKTIAAAVLNDMTKSEETDDGRVFAKVVAQKVAVRLLDAETGKELRRIDGFADNLPVIALAFRPDGKELLSGAGFFPLAGPASNYPKPAKDAVALRVIALEAPMKEPAPVSRWKEQAALEISGSLIGSTAYSPDGKLLVVGGTGGIVQAYDTTTRKKLWEYKAEGSRFAAVAFSQDGKTVACTFASERLQGIRFLDAATGKAGDVLEDDADLNAWPEPLSVAVFPDQVVREGAATLRKVIYGNTREYSVKSWLVGGAPSTTNLRVAVGKEPADRFAAPLAVAPNGKHAAVTGPVNRDTGKNVFCLWSAGGGAGFQLLEGHKAVVVSAAWSKDGKTIVSGDAGGIVILWDAETFKEKSRLNLDGRVAAVAIAADGKTIAAAVVRKPEDQKEEAYSEEVFVWDAASPPKKPEPISSKGSGSSFRGMASVNFSPDGKTLAIGFCNYTHLAFLGELTGKVRFFSIDPDAVKVAPVAVVDGWKVQAELTQHAGPVDSVAFAKDGTAFVSGGADGKILLWNAVTLKAQELGAVVPAGKHTAVAFSPDGKLVAATRDNVTGFFDAAKRQTVLMNPPVKGGRGVAFSPDGKWVATSDGFRTGFQELADGAGGAGSSSRVRKNSACQSILSR